MASTAPTVIEAGTPPPVEQRAFPWFVCLWAVATLFHQAAWPAKHVGLPMYGLTLAAIIVLLKPRSVGLFIGFVLLQAAMVLHQLPYDTSNHWLFTGFVAVTILLAWLGLVARHQTSRIDGGELLHAFAPVVRIQVVILYFYAVLHKLNHDFLTPGVSCATDVMARVAHTIPGLPMGSWSDYLAIYGTLAVEAAIPVLLLMRRTRIAGALLGAVFHLLLVFDARWVFYDFSSLVYALYFLFVAGPVLGAVDRLKGSPGLPGQAIDRMSTSRTTAVVRRILIALAGLVTLAFVLSTVTGRGPDSHAGVYWLMRHLPRLPFLIYGSLAMGLLAYAWRHRPSGGANDLTVTLRPRSIAAIMVPVVFLNGLTPYVGLKTENAFSMFSNLATEGGRTNHLFVPVRYRVAGYQEDLVQVLESSDRRLQALADQGETLPFFEFRARASRAPDNSVRYVRAGAAVNVVSIRSSPELMTEPPFLLRKGMKFRLIPDFGGPRACSH